MSQFVNQQNARPGGYDPGAHKIPRFARYFLEDKPHYLDDPEGEWAQRDGMQHETGTTFIFSSHDPALLEIADDRIHIVDGRIDRVEFSMETLQ